MSEYWASYIPTAIWFVIVVFVVWGWLRHTARLRNRAEAFASAQNEAFLNAHSRFIDAMERIAGALEVGNLGPGADPRRTDSLSRQSKPGGGTDRGN
jgi:hypothetical protein